MFIKQHKEATMLHSEYLAAIKLVMDDESYKDCPDCGGEGIHEHDCPGGCRRCNYLGYIACGSCEGTGRVPKDPEQFEAMGLTVTVDEDLELFRRTA